jgi:secondary thiamine-phosphate synthase enzyme
VIVSLSCPVNGQGLYDITEQVCSSVSTQVLGEGLCTLYIRHTSASLLIQENYDASAKTDLEKWLNKLVPENDPIYSHTTEGPDDMPAHIKSALTATSLSIPVQAGKLMLGTWQGIFLWEHRHRPGEREIVMYLAE